MYFNSSGIFRRGRSVFIIIENVLCIIYLLIFFFFKNFKKYPTFWNPVLWFFFRGIITFKNSNADTGHLFRVPKIFQKRDICSWKFSPFIRTILSQE